MKEFLELNKHKLLFVYKLTTILCLCIYFLNLAILNKQDFKNIKLLIQIFIGEVILFPVFILLIVYLHWENEKRYYNKFIKAKIVKKENCFGYSEKLIDENSKFFFTKKILSKNINGFEIDVKFEYKTIGFYTYAVNKNIEKTRLKYFDEKSKELNIENFIFRVFYINIERKKFDEITFKEIELKLVKFLNLLEEYNYKPEK